MAQMIKNGVFIGDNMPLIQQIYPIPQSRDAPNTRKLLNKPHLVAYVLHL
jgi:hypothetical protein